METVTILPVEETFTLPCCADPFCEGCGPAPLHPETPFQPMSVSELDELYIEWMELVEEDQREQEEALVRRLFW